MKKLLLILLPVIVQAQQYDTFLFKVRSAKSLKILSFSAIINQNETNPITIINFQQPSVPNHTHSESEVTNLVSDLAGKAASAHTHAYASLTGLPTIPSNTNQLTNGAGFLVAADISGKQNTITTGTSAQYFKGDLSIGTFPTTTAAFINSTDKNFVTDAKLTVVNNTSGTNTGDNSPNTTYANDFRAANFVSGTNYLAPNGSAALLTSFPTLNQNTTGTAGGLSANIAESQVTNLVNDLAAKAPLISPSFTTPVIGVATGTSLAVTGNITSSAGGIGYVTGNGGAITQLTNKSTTVILNKLTGDITTNAASLAAAAIVSFTLTNSTIAATDIIHVQHQTTGTFGAYTITGRTAAGSAVISIRNNTAGALAEAIVIKFIVIKSAIN